MSAIELKSYEVLKNKLGENEANTLIEYFESKTEEKFAEKKEALARILRQYSTVLRQCSTTLK